MSVPLNETLAPKDIPRNIQLPVAALIGSGAETMQLPERLYGEVRQYRSQVTYEGAVRGAQDVIGDESHTMRIMKNAVSPHGERGLITGDGVLIGDLVTRIASDRVDIAMLGRMIGVGDLLQKTRTLKRGEALHLESGKGYTLTADAYQDGRSSWRLQLAEGLDQAGRESAVDALSDTMKTLADPMATTRAELSAGLSTDRPIVYSSESFHWAQDADTIMNFLDRAAIPVNWDDSPAMQRAKFIEYLYSLPAHYPGDEVTIGKLQRTGIYFDERGKIQKVLIPVANAGVYFGLQSADTTLAGDLTDIPLKIGMEVYADEAYAGRNFIDRHYEVSNPFVETETASQLLGSFEAAGLEISAQLMGIISETDIDKLFGHGYAALTREIAKIVNDPERGLDHLFDTTDGAISEKIRSLVDVQDPAAQVVIELLKGVVDRAIDPKGLPVLKPSQRRVKIRDGSCKDIEIYLADGKMVESVPRLLHSSYERPTTMTLEPSYLNGVRLPAGTLLAKEEDGYLMMRVTSYAFKEEVATQTFGIQEAKNKKHAVYAKRQVIRSLMNLDHVSN